MIQLPFNHIEKIFFHNSIPKLGKENGKKEDCLFIYEIEKIGKIEMKRI